LLLLLPLLPLHTALPPPLLPPPPQLPLLLPPLPALR
jgi:hypothetical protein